MSFLNLKLINSRVEKKALEKIRNLVGASSFVGGDELRLFEKNFAKAFDSKFCIGVGSGTDALRTALSACGIKRGDEVVTTPISYTSTSLAIAHCNAIPVFVDVLEDGNIDPSKIEAALTKKTKAILIVHMYGNPCQMDEIKKIARKYELFLVDDCSHAHGSVYKGKKVGSISDISCFSLYPSKTLGAWGDAGAITTNTKSLYEKALLYKNYGEEVINYSKIIGYNSKLDTLQAAVLNEKLKYLSIYNKERSKVAKLYTESLRGIGDVYTLKYSPSCSYYVFPIKTQYREKLMKHLKSKGIPTLIHYPLAIHLQECFKYLGYKKGDFSMAEEHSKTVLSLSLVPFIKPEVIVKEIKSFFDN